MCNFLNADDLVAKYANSEAGYGWVKRPPTKVENDINHIRSVLLNSLKPQQSSYIIWEDFLLIGKMDANQAGMRNDSKTMSVYKISNSIEPIDVLDSEQLECISAITKGKKCSLRATTLHNDIQRAVNILNCIPKMFRKSLLMGNLHGKSQTMLPLQIEFIEDQPLTVDSVKNQNSVSSNYSKLVAANKHSPLLNFQSDRIDVLEIAAKCLLNESSLSEEIWLLSNLDIRYLPENILIKDDSILNYLLSADDYEKAWILVCRLNDETIISKCPINQVTQPILINKVKSGLSLKDKPEIIKHPALLKTQLHKYPNSLDVLASALCGFKSVPLESIEILEEGLLGLRDTVPLKALDSFGAYFYKMPIDELQTFSNISKWSVMKAICMGITKERTNQTKWFTWR